MSTASGSDVSSKDAEQRPSNSGINMQLITSLFQQQQKHNTDMLEAFRATVAPNPVLSAPLPHPTVQPQPHAPAKRRRSDKKNKKKKRKKKRRRRSRRHRNKYKRNEHPAPPRHRPSAPTPHHYDQTVYPPPHVHTPTTTNYYHSSMCASPRHPPHYDDYYAHTHTAAPSYGNTHDPPPSPYPQPDIPSYSTPSTYSHHDDERTHQPLYQPSTEYDEHSYY